MSTFTWIGISERSFFNQLLQKKLKLSKSSYYSAMNAMKEGREVGRNRKPPYLRDVEKAEFWDWVECNSHEGKCATMKEMREYVTHIVRVKRPAVLHNRTLVSRWYIRKILGKGGLMLDKCTIPILLRNFYPLMRRAISSLS